MRTKRIQWQRSRGVTIFELSVTAGMLAVFLAASVQMIAALGLGERAADRRALAQHAVDNLVEEIIAMPWHRVTLTELSALELPAPVSARLPGGKLALEIQQETQPVTARRVTVSLKWNDPRGRLTGPVRLTTWIFKPAEEAP